MTEKSARTMRIEIAPEDRRPLTARRGIPPAAIPLAARSRERSDSDYWRLLQSIYDAVLITDGEGRVVDFNHRVEEFFLFDHGAFPRTVGSPGTELEFAL